MKRLLTFLFLATVVFAGCNKDKGDKTVTIGDNIIGKWIKADVNGQPAPTNEKKVYTFVSSTKAYISASLDTRPELGTLWSDRLESDVVISGNKLTLTLHPNEHHTGVEEFTVTDIDDNEFTANRKLTVTIDGNVVVTEEKNSALSRSPTTTPKPSTAFGRDMSLASSRSMATIRSTAGSTTATAPTSTTTRTATAGSPTPPIPSTSTSLTATCSACAGSATAPNIANGGRLPPSRTM